MTQWKTRRIVVSALAGLVMQVLVCPILAVAAQYDLAAGTPVLVVLNEAINPMSATVGQTVRLSVAAPVTVQGVTVIAAGAPVIAEVSAAEKSGAIGKPARVGVMLRTVTAVDGSSIALSGQKLTEGENKQTTSLVVTLLCCVLGLLMKGGEADIPAGSQIQASTIAPASVTA